MPPVLASPLSAAHCEKRQVFPMAALAVLSRRLEASLWDRNGSKTRVFDAVPRPTAYADYSAARAASSKRVCHFYPSSPFQPRSWRPQGEWTQVMPELVLCMAVMQPCTRTISALNAHAAERSALHSER